MHKLVENQVKISVRNLVEFVLRSGDIDNRHSTKAQYDAMQLGSRLHRKIQSAMTGEYRAEVSLKHTAYYEDVEILLEGRADGIITPKTNPVSFQADVTDIDFTIDEIKVIRQDMEKLEEAAPVHIAQAVCYAYMYAIQKKSDKIKQDARSDFAAERSSIGIQTFFHKLLI